VGGAILAGLRRGVKRFAIACSAWAYDTGIEWPCWAPPERSGTWRTVPRWRSAELEWACITRNPEQVAYIVDHSEARILVIENNQQWRKVEAIRGKIPHVQKIVMMEPSSDASDPE